MSDIAIKLENVSKYYKLYKDPKDRLKEALHPFKKKYHKPFYALKSLNLEIKKGDVLGVVGRNGCGKSTLLKVITGVLQPNQGSISVKGKITALLELGAGFNPEFTGIDNIQFYAKILGIPDQEFEEKLPSIIAFAELGEFLYQPVKTYSSGMKSRLGFAVAVHVDPEILILDEVLAVGDAAFQSKCYREIRKFFESGKTVIFVSHSYQNIVSLCNKAILIVDGCVVMEGKPKDVWALHKEVMFNPKKTVDELIQEKEKEKENIQKIIQQKDGDKVQEKPQRIIVAKKDLSVFARYTNDYGEFERISIVDMESNSLVHTESLYKNRNYKVIINFKSFVNLTNASFGVQIRALTGLVISGVNQRDFLGLSGRNIVAGEVVEIELELNCLLNAGNYFISCFVLSDNDYSVIADEYVRIEVQSEEKNGGVVRIFDSIKTKIIREKKSNHVPGEQGGAWTEDVHKLLHPTNFNQGLADFLSNEIDFNSVLEFGSGLGFLARSISDNRNLDVYHCIEPNQIKGNYRSDSNPRLFPLNIFDEAHPAELDRQYELICSIEVAEHIPRSKHKYLFDYLVSKANKWIVFSAARIGQGGYGHIAERHEEDWKSEFLKRGCVFSKDLTDNIRNACDEKNINHRKNLMVFSVSTL